MSKMAELVMDIEDMVEQGYSALSIAAKLNIPLNWAQEVVEDRYQLEQQKQNETIGYDYE